MSVLVATVNFGTTAHKDALHFVLPNLTTGPIEIQVTVSTTALLPILQTTKLPVSAFCTVTPTILLATLKLGNVLTIVLSASTTIILHIFVSIDVQHLTTSQITLLEPVF